MCDSCGCGDSELVPVEIQERILSGNERAARHNREHFEAEGVFAVNLMGSPGSGKTAVLEATAQARTGLSIGAMSGDLATDNDGERLRRSGIPAVSITTGSACHLDAELVHKGLHALDWHGLDLLFIENVGNLVCPAVYDLGQAENVVCLSVTEGEDKPLKYPVMFRKADLVLITKTDLIPHLPGFDMEKLIENLGRVMPGPRVIAVSAVTGKGLPLWLEWLEERHRARVALNPAVRAQRHHHHHRLEAPV
jgi:hydrogenase nickel incorporation protein HypB